MKGAINTNIKSKEYQLTKKDFFKICFFINLKRFTVLALIYLALFGIAVFLRFLNAYWFSIAIFFIVLIPVFLVWGFLRYVNSKENKNFYQMRTFEIDDDFVAIYLSDGGLGKTRLNSLIKAVKTSKYYMLFISQIQFYYLPKSAFA